MSKKASVPFATTLHIRDHCLCLHAQRTARALARHFDQALRPLGLTNGQFSLLMSLNRPQPPNMTAVATLLAMDRTTLTAALKPLEKKGYVRIVIAESDKRNRRLVLTEDGSEVLAAAVPIWHREHDRIEALLGDPDRLRADLLAPS